MPLYRVTGKNEFRWDTEQQQAFEKIKELLTSAPVLTMPNGHDAFILDTDASNEAIGAELSTASPGWPKEGHHVRESFPFLRAA